ncbi:MAG: asparagine synthase (glutamine-hydrolyzing) [Candidatus Omnitrophica bacterium]|nr:asparagine synthase (glutamine-hydrolyzing) [Candidatus Omnitrophota bacterium]
MCGIYGYIEVNEEGLFERMGRSLRHRGPDGEGVWSDRSVALGNQRLAIVDVEGGKQPFASEDGRVRAVVNGEIYNHAELRRGLEAKGHRFRSRCDCEVAAHLYEEEGPDFVKSLNGEFAIALWDAGSRHLLLVRDRLGIRPLYYAESGKGLIFASETKAILESGRVSRTINTQAVDDYLSYRYTHGEHTFFSSIRRLLPGHILVWEEGHGSSSRYWSVPAAGARGGGGDPGQFLSLLEDSVRLRLMSDVPVGLFLSGGVDSALIAALVKRVGTGRVRTFSIGFGRRDDELAAAKERARALGTEHSEHELKPADLYELPRMVWHLDEPVGDAIIVPTFALARMAAGEVKVILTGEGADELMAGYVHQRTLLFLENILRLVPGRWVSRVVSAWVGRLPARFLDLFFAYPARAGNEGRERLKSYLEDFAHAARAVGHFTSLFEPRDKDTLYHSEWKRNLSEGELSDDAARLTRLNGARGGRLVERLLDAEMETWLPDYTLHKQDKLLMAHSLEGRVPYLDHRLVEWTAPLGLRSKLAGGSDKVLLREAAAGVLGERAAWRKKHAFFLPLEGEYNNALLELAGRYLDRDRVAARGILRVEGVERIMRLARGRSLLYTKQLAALLILEIWFRLFVDRDRTLVETPTVEHLL